MEPINILFIIVFLIVIYLIYRDGMEKFSVTVTDGVLNLGNGWSIESDADKISFKKGGTQKFAFGDHIIPGAPVATARKINAMKLGNWTIYDAYNRKNASYTSNEDKFLMFISPEYNLSNRGAAGYFQNNGYWHVGDKNFNEDANT